MNLENVQVLKNIIKYLFQRCSKTTFKRDFWLNSVSWDFPIVSTLEEQCFRLRGQRVYIKPRIPPGLWEHVPSSALSTEGGNAAKEREKAKFLSIVKSMPMSGWYQSHICMLLSLLTKLFHMIHLILKISPWNTINGVINLIL